MYGNPPPKVLSYVSQTATNDLVDKYLKTREQINRVQRKNLEVVQQKEKGKYFWSRGYGIPSIEVVQAKISGNTSESEPFA